MIAAPSGPLMLNHRADASNDFDFAYDDDADYLGDSVLGFSQGPPPHEIGLLTFSQAASLLSLDSRSMQRAALGPDAIQVRSIDGEDYFHTFDLHRWVLRGCIEEN